MIFRGLVRRYHSPETSRFLTNLTHKKRCSCGGRLALPWPECLYCGSLSENHSVVQEADPLTEAILHGSLSDGPFEPVFQNFDALYLRPKTQKLGFDHLIGVPKMGVYDLRQLKKKHLKVMTKISKVGHQVLADLLNGPKQLRALAPPNRAPKWTPDLVGDYLALGLLYPSEYNLLAFHFVMPPYAHTRLFESAFYYPWSFVETQLQQYGKVRRQDLQPDNTLEILEIHRRDGEMRGIQEKYAQALDKLHQ